MAFDVITPVNMGRGEVPTSTGTLYTVPANQRDILKSMDISNTNSAPGYVTVYLVPDGDSPAVANTLIPNVKIPGNGIFQWSGTQVLNEGDTIRAVADRTLIAINLSGGGAI